MVRSHQLIEREQLQKQVDSALALAWVRQPPIGWLATVRKALGITTAALGKRLGTTQPNITQLEKSERDGRATINSMRDAAEAMGCRFVYAIVPREGDSIASIIEAQAERKARQIIREASVHMALEAQQLSAEDTQREIERVKRQLIAEMPRDFWKTGGDHD